MSGKRKRHSFNDPRPSIPSTITTQPRRTLQRTSKDRAYAERLAAAGDTVSGFVSSVDVHKGRALESTKRRPRKKREEVPPGWPFVDASIRSNEREKQSRATNYRKKKPQVKIETEVVNDLPVLTRRQHELLTLDNDGDKNLLRQVESGSMDDDVFDSKTNDGGDMSNYNAESKSATSPPGTEISRKCNNCSLINSSQCKKCRAGRSSLGFVNEDTVAMNNGLVSEAEGSKPINRDKDNSPIKETVSTDFKEPETISSNIPKSPLVNNESGEPENNSSSINAKSPTPLKPMSNTAKTWTCSRCSLSNSNRRKKCQVCGNIRHLTVTSDGTFALSDGSGDAASCAVSSADTGSANSGDNVAESNSVVISSNHSQNGATTAAMPTDTDLFAIASEPVSTRSKFKQLRLSQGMTQAEDEVNGSHQFSPLSNREASLTANSAEGVAKENVNFNQQNGNSSCETSTSSNVQQSEEIEQSIAFREMFKKRRSDRHDRRRAKRVKKYLRSSGKVEVRVRLAGGAELDGESNNVLVAYVPLDVLSRMQTATVDGDEKMSEVDCSGEMKCIPNECAGDNTNGCSGIDTSEKRLSNSSLHPSGSSDCDSCDDNGREVISNQSLLDLTENEKSAHQIPDCIGVNEIPGTDIADFHNSEKMSKVRIRVCFKGSESDVGSNQCLVACLPTDLLSRIKFALVGDHVSNLNHLNKDNELCSLKSQNGLHLDGDLDTSDLQQMLTSPRCCPDSCKKGASDNNLDPVAAAQFSDTISQDLLGMADHVQTADNESEPKSGNTNNVTVRLLLEGPELDADYTQSLTAFVPTEVMSTIQFARVHGLNAMMGSTDISDENAAQDKCSSIPSSPLNCFGSGKVHNRDKQCKEDINQDLSGSGVSASMESGNIDDTEAKLNARNEVVRENAITNSSDATLATTNTEEPQVEDSEENDDDNASGLQDEMATDSFIGNYEHDVMNDKPSTTSREASSDGTSQKQTQAFVQLSHIPMTQQMFEFDYLSQVSMK
jgi:hypothetical protein